jgi:hypothetical protein
MGHGWTCDVHSATRRKLRRHDRVSLIHSSSGTCKQLISNAPHSVLIDYNIYQLLHPISYDEGPLTANHDDLFDHWVFE